MKLLYMRFENPYIHAFDNISHFDLRFQNLPFYCNLQTEKKKKKDNFQKTLIE